MSELRELLYAAKGTPFGSVERGKVTENLVLNAETYAGLEERVAELESQLEASQGALREQMQARRDAWEVVERVDKSRVAIGEILSEFPAEGRWATAGFKITQLLAEAIGDELTAAIGEPND